MALKEGINAPEFSASIDGGGKISLNKLSGKWVILYFYPKDNTSNCTKESCDYRDKMERLSTLNAVIIGVSPDSIKSHDKFKEKYNLNFNLISDTDKKICIDYDIIGEKSMFGKKYMGVVRTTYIINPKGKIAVAYSPVKVEGHVEEVITKLKELQSNK